MEDYTQGTEVSTETTETYETTGADYTPDAAGQEYAEQTETTTETGEEDAAAGQEGAGGEQQATTDLKVETAFAKRLAAEREKIQREVYQQAQQQIMQELSPLLKLAQTEASKYGMTPVQWAQAVEANREQQFRQQLTKYAEEQGLNPAEVEQFVNQHPAVLQARQQQHFLQQQQAQMESQQRFNQEAQELFEMFPDAKPTDIPAEVWQMREQRGIPLAAAYAIVTHRTAKEQAKAQGEQAAIAAMRQRQQASTGSAKGTGAVVKTAWDLPTDQFNQMVEKALRGEQVKF